MYLHGNGNGFGSSRSGRFRQTFQSLSNKNFRIYTIGQLVSLIGTWMQITALPWLVYTMTGSASALGMVSFAGGLPLLLLTYVGGTVSDKFPRRAVMMTMQALAMLQAIVLFYIAYNGVANLYFLIGIAFFGGCVTAIDLPNRQAFVTDLVDEESRTNAIGLNSAIWNFSRMIGPALAGFVIAAFSEYVCFGINAVSFLASLGTLFIIKVKPKEKEVECDSEVDPDCKESEKVNVWKLLIAAPILTVLFLSMVTSLFGFQPGVLMPVIVDEILNGSSQTLGFLSAAAGLGALVGSLFLAGTKDNPQRIRVMIGITCILLAGSIFTLAISTSLTLSLVAVALSGACVSTQLSGGMSLVQGSVDKSVRGRLMGVYSTFMVGFAPFAAMIAGWLGSTIGVSYTLIIAASAILGSSLIYLAAVYAKGLTKPVKDDN